MWHLYIRNIPFSKTKQSEAKRFKQGGLVAEAAQVATFDTFEQCSAGDLARQEFFLKYGNNFQKDGAAGFEATLDGGADENSLSS